MPIQMTRAEYEVKYGTPPPVSNNGPIKMTRAEYDAKYNPKTPTYDIQQTPVAKANKVAQINTETAQFQKEAKQANSPLGLAGNFGKALVTNIAPSEVGLGKTIAKTFGNQSKVYSDASQQTSDMQTKLIKLIREKESRGEDTTKQKQIYNDLVKQQGELGGGLKDENNLPSAGKALGQIGGTALDILTAGTYGKAKTAGMTTGQLYKSIPMLPGVKTVATATGLPELGKIAEQKASGLFTKPGALNVLKGAGIGYASDVTLGLQGLRGKDREGKNALIPGLGTAIGTAIPLVSEITQSVKNYRNPDIKMQKLQSKINKDVDNIVSSTKGTTNKTKLYLDKNTDVAENLKDPYIFKGLKVENKKINPDEAIASIDDRIEKVLDAKRKILPEVDRVTSPITKAELRTRAIDNVLGTVAPADQVDIIRSIDRQLEPLPDEISASTMDGLRALFRKSARDAKGLLKRGNEYSALEVAARDSVFDLTDNLPFDSSSTYKTLNDYVRNMIDTKTFLDKTLRGQTVKGGKLGEYAGRGIGAIAGMKFGPLGAIGGSELGGTISNVITNNQLGNSQKLKIIEGLTDDPDILNQVDNLLNQAKNYVPPLLPAPTSTFRSQQRGGATINLPSRSPSRVESEEIARIQAQFSPKMSLQNTANNIIANAPKNAISDSIPQATNNASLVEQIYKQHPNWEFPKIGSIDQLIETHQGWEVPGLKKVFDDALYNKDAGLIKKLIPDVPQEYLQRFAKNISSIIGIIPFLPGIK